MSILSNVCEDEITKQLRKLSKGIKWNSRIKFLSSSSKIDTLGTDYENIYIIELELSREDPVNNVAKVFFQLDKEKQKFFEKRIWFFHIFSKKYSTGSKKQIAEFVGNKMADEYDNVNYISLILDITPKKDQDITDDFIDSCDKPITSLVNDLIKIINSPKYLN